MSKRVDDKQDRRNAGRVKKKTTEERETVGNSSDGNPIKKSKQIKIYLKDR